MADSRLEYGILRGHDVRRGPPEDDQHRLHRLGGARALGVLSKRSEIIDLTKLIVHRILFKKFENETSRMFMASALIKKWNRRRPGALHR